jgi:hypothetical protein
MSAIMSKSVEALVLGCAIAVENLFLSILALIPNEAKGEKARAASGPVQTRFLLKKSKTLENILTLDSL